MDFVRTKRGRRDVYLAMTDTTEECGLSASRYGTGLCLLYDLSLTERQQSAIRNLDTGGDVYEVFARLPEVALIAPTAQNKRDFDLGSYWVGVHPDLDPFDPYDFRMTAIAMLITLSEDL